MIDRDFLNILRCPACVRERNGELELHLDTWLVCKDCGRKYPIQEDIPVMLIEEGDRWIDVPLADLPLVKPNSKRQD